MTSQRCNGCGAILSEGSDCQAAFDSFLTLEFTNPDYGQVHMLTVACFMIQHGRYSDEALIWIKNKLHEYLDEGMPINYILHQAKNENGQNKRAFKINRAPDAPPLPRIKWSMTIMDVALNYKDASSYNELVKQWAILTQREMVALSPALH